jgi:aryl-alcohol dehydrogenase-like predicted oxidoreductase
MPLALDQGIGTFVWSPLGWGRLTGKLRRGVPPPETSRLPETKQAGPPVDDEYLFDVVEVMDQVAAETGRSVPQIALNWLLRRPTVSSVIIGARTEAQLRDNLAAANWTLDADQVRRLDVASARPVTYPYWHQRHEFASRNPPPA